MKQTIGGGAGAMCARALMALAVAALCGPACSKESETRGPAAAPGSGTMSDETRTLLGAVPAGAPVVAYLDSPRTFWDHLLGTGVMAPSEKTRKALDSELRAFLGERIGADFTGFRTAAGFVDPASQRAGVILQGISGKLPGNARGQHAGAELFELEDDVFAARSGELTVVGNQAGVRAVLDVLGGKAESMVAADTPLWKWIQSDCTGAFVGVAGSVEGVPEPQIQAMAGQFGVQRACVHLGAGGLRAVLQGDGAKLKNLADMAEQQLGVVRAELAEEKRRATAPDGDPVEGAAAILAYHHASDFLDRVQPRIDGDRLQVSLPLETGDAMLPVALVGIGAAVAIPAFMKYTRKSKGSEAAVLTRQLYDGARTHVMDGPARSLDPGDGAALPPSAGPTPPLGACCAQGGKCAPDAAQWDTPTWTALQFSVDDPHYYSYQFVNSGTGFTVRALGDLDCDGVYATFEMVGELGPDGVPGGVPPMYRENETE